MRQQFTLTYSTREYAANLTFQADTMIVLNQSPYTLLVRRGSLDIPTETNYDLIVSAGNSLTIPVSTNAFGIRLSIDEVISPFSSLPCVVIFSREENPSIISSVSFPNFYSINYNIAPNTTEEFIIDCRDIQFIFTTILHNSLPPNADGNHDTNSRITYLWSNDKVNFFAFDTLAVAYANQSRKSLPTPFKYLMIRFQVTSGSVGNRTGSINFSKTDGLVYYEPSYISASAVASVNYTPSVVSTGYTQDERDFFGSGIIRDVQLALNYQTDKVSTIIADSVVSQVPYSFFWDNSQLASNNANVEVANQPFSGLNTTYINKTLPLDVYFRLGLPVIRVRIAVLRITSAPALIVATASIRLRINLPV